MALALGRAAQPGESHMEFDGKGLRRSFDRAGGKSALHRVSAWGCERRLVLAQTAAAAKSNEITAAPKRLATPRLKGTIVTADALNRRRAIARQIVDRGGDYALAVKGNQATLQGTLHDDVAPHLDDPASTAIAAEPVVEADHGRVETRSATVSTAILHRHRGAEQRPSLAGLAAVGKVRAAPRNRQQDAIRDRLSSAQRAVDARTLQ